MTVLSASIDILCAPPTDRRHLSRTAPSESFAPASTSTCSRRAVLEIIGLLASAHDGLHRDQNGTWWTGDGILLLATPEDHGRWVLLNEIARALGFEV